MNVAIVGCGHIAQSYLDGLAAYPNLDLVATADLVLERAESLAEPFGARAYDDVTALLTDDAVDLVVNLTLHSAHASVTRACLEAGRHVVSEKPLTLDAAEARELVERADAHGCVLACAPVSGWADAQQQAAHLLRSGHLGPVRVATATGNFGRLTDWNANPEPFLRVGPLYDGAVYPLTVLTTIFGPVTRVRSADASLLLAEHTYEGRTFTVETPDHVTATLEMTGGVRVDLTASMYVPYQTKHFSDLEFHGDAGSLYLSDAGNFDGAPSPLLEVARVGRDYRVCPMRRPPAPLSYAAAIADAARAVEHQRSPVTSGRQAAHLVAVIETILGVAESGNSTDVDAVGFSRPELLPWTQEAEPHRSVHPLLPNSADPDVPSTRAPVSGDALPLPPVGFGCSRYRGGTIYVDLDASIADALAAGYRLFDTAELYGTENTLGDLLQSPGGPSREDLCIVGKPWRTNHAPEHLRAAADASLDRLGLDAFDVYMLHWPGAWAHQGPLGDVSELSHEEATALTFPTDDDGRPVEADVTLLETWAAMEDLVRDGRAHALGICNVSEEDLQLLLTKTDHPPRVIQVECHPYHAPAALIDAAHEAGLRVMAHSPLSAPGLLSDETLQQIAHAHDVSTAQVVLRWNVQNGVIPIPSSTSPDHVHANLDVFRFHLSREEMDAVDGLHRPDFSR